MAYTVVRVNAWTLRCIFNQSKIVDRHAVGEFTAILEKSGLPKTRPPGTKSEQWLYQDRNGNEVAKAHRYVIPTGVPTPLDPKSVKIGNLRYQLHVGRMRANPERWLWFVGLKKCYGWIERKRCAMFGAIAVVPPT
jgi:hypothetical protein